MSEQDKPTRDEIRDLVNECGLDWHRGFAPLFDGDDTNRYEVLVSAALAADRAARPVLAADSFEWSSLYNAVSHMMARLGFDGAIHPDNDEAERVMDALHRLDAGQFVPGLAPRAARPALTDEQIKEIVLRVVYEGDASTAHRDAWAAEIGIPVARAVLAAATQGST